MSCSAREQFPTTGLMFRFVTDRRMGTHEAANIIIILVLPYNNQMCSSRVHILLKSIYGHRMTPFATTINLRE